MGLPRVFRAKDEYIFTLDRLSRLFVCQAALPGGIAPRESLFTVQDNKDNISPQKICLLSRTINIICPSTAVLFVAQDNKDIISIGDKG